MKNIQKTIEYDRVIFGHRNEHYSDQDLLLLIEESAADNPSDRHWRNIASFGWEFQLWSDIGQRAGHCEVGNIFFPLNELLSNKKSVKMEDYVALYRETLKNITPVEQLFEQFDITASVKLKGNSDQYMLVSNIEDTYTAEDIEDILFKNQAKLIPAMEDGIRTTSAQFPVKTIAALRPILPLARKADTSQSSMKSHAGASVSITFQKRT